MSLLVENPERLPDLVLDLSVLDLPEKLDQLGPIDKLKFNLDVLDLPEKLSFANFVLNPTHLVISQTNSLKLIEPFPS